MIDIDSLKFKRHYFLFCTLACITCVMINFGFITGCAVWFALEAFWCFLERLVIYTLKQLKEGV